MGIGTSLAWGRATYQGNKAEEGSSRAAGTHIDDVRHVEGHPAEDEERLRPPPCARPCAQNAAAAGTRGSPYAARGGRMTRSAGSRGR